FSVAPRWENGHHAIARHPTMGILEVHVQLYDEIVEDVWFQAVDRSDFIREPQQKIETADGTYYTLGDTDHLIFLTLHMVKHFILCGMSLRMMLDVARFYSCHREHLDTRRLWEILCKLKYDQFINAVLWSMIRYCGFTLQDFPGIQSEDGQQIELILNDLESGGWLGKNNQTARTAGWYEYNRQLLMKDKSRWRYWLYMLNWKHSFKLRTLFPDKKRLARDYPWVLKYPYLIPFAWIHRIIFRGGALLKKNALTAQIVSDETDISDESRLRVSMFRELGML
ncbi:MAG: nucleotidyltransferase family protein, partial [Eubacteriales bacterium]